MSEVTVRQRADERTIVAGTTARFVQLAALLVISSGSVLSSFWIVTAHSDHFGGLGCLLAAGIDPDNGDVTANYVPTVTNAAAFNACDARYENPPPAWANGIWPLGMILLAGLLILVLPEITRRWRHLVPLADVDPSGRLREAVDAAAARAGLTVPELFFDPFSRGNGAMVFGRNSNPRVSLDADLVAAFERDRATFDAVVLHELAHIRNRDVTVSTATLCVWRVYVTLVALPGLGVLLWEVFSSSLSADPFFSGEAPTLTRDLLFPVLLTALAYLVRADVLRAREVYADRTAQRWGASEHVWERPEPSASGVRRLLRTVRETGRWHPRWSLRRQALAGPDALFRLDPLQMFLAGAATIMIAAGGDIYLSRDSASGANTWSALVPELLAAAAAVAVVAVALWRALAYAVLNGLPRVPSGITAGFWFGAGLVLGEWETGRPAVTQFVPSRPWLELAVLCAGPAFCWWTAAAVRLWFAARPQAENRPALAVVLIAAMVLATAWLRWWPGAGSALMIGFDNVRTMTDQLQQSFPGVSSAHRGLLHAMGLLAPIWAGWDGTLSVLAGSVLWFVPLIGIVAGGLLRRERPAVGGLPGHGLSLLRPLAGALGIGAICAVGGIAVAKASVHAGYPAPDRYTALFLIMVLSWICVAIILSAVVAATVAAVRVPQHRLPAALVAATGTTMAGLVVTFFTQSADGCVRPLADSMHRCVWLPRAGWTLTAQLTAPVLTFSTLAAFAVAFIVTALARLSKRFQGRMPRPDTRPSAPPTRPRYAAWVLGAAVVVLGALAVIAVSAAPSTGSQGPGVGSEAVKTMLLAADTPVNVPDSIRAIQLEAWLQFGGLQIDQRFSDELGRFSKHLDQAGASSPSGDLGTRWTSAFEGDCRALDQVAQDADTYFPVPDPSLQPVWTQSLAETANGTGACLNALRQSDGTAFEASLKVIIDAARKQDAVYTAIDIKIKARR